MKKILLAMGILLGALQVHAVDYLVQTGATGDATWDASVATQTGATIVSLADSSTTIDAWIAANAAGKETWLAAGTYNFAATCKNGTSTVLYGGFAGTETATSQRTKGDNAWDFTNATIFNGGAFQMFSGTGQKQLFDGITFQNATFAGNGAIMRVYDNSTIQNCQFKFNHGTTAGAQGGALQVYNAAVTLDKCYFEGNEGGQGGAFFTNSTKVVTISQCYFKDNYVHSTSTAANSGGAVHMQGAGQVLMDRCFFTGNHVDNSKNGAALSNANSATTTAITNCVFYANNCNKNAVFSQCPGLFYNNTIAENQGGCAYITKGDLQNNVFYGSTKAMAAMAVNAAAVSATNNATVIAFGTSTVATGTVMIDSINTGSAEGVNYANFTDPANGNFLPAVGSALIDAGATIATMTCDYRGYLRNVGGLDIGAYEYGATPPTPHYTLTVVAGANGTVKDVTTGEIASGSYTLDENATMSFSIKADSLYRIAHVIYNNVDVTASLIDGVYTIPAITANSTLEVSFEVVLGSLLVKSNHIELLTYNGAAVDTLYEDLTMGSKLTFGYTLPQYYTLKSVTFNGANITATATDSTIITSAIQGNDTLAVTFNYREPLIDETSKVVYVKVGGTGDGSTWGSAMGDIAAALVEAKYDPTNPKDVWIAAGTYNITETLIMKDSVNIYGGFAGTEAAITERAKASAKPWDYANATILDGGNAVEIMAAKKAMAASLVVDGITFQNGSATGTDNGGAIRLNVNVTLQNCICRNNYSSGAAGAVQIYPAGDVYGCLLENNLQETNANGGGAINGNTSSAGYTISIENCTFRGNISRVRGGAINIQGSTASTINGCTFYNNTAATAEKTMPGAAIYDNSANQTTITNNVFFNNTGATACYLKPHIFANNTVIKNAGQVYVAAGNNQTEVINNIVWACATDNTGATPTSLGGVAVSGMKMMYNYTYNPVSADKNWTLSDDDAVANTNVQFFSNLTNGDVTVADTIDTGDRLTSGPKFRKVATFIGAIPEGLSTEDANVFLIELDSVDLQLNAASPCVNAGKNLDYIAVDVAGTARPQGQKFDVGAYELGYYDLAIGTYDATVGGVYSEDGTLLEAGSAQNVVYSQEVILYFLSNDGQMPAKVTTTASTDGGLTFDGEVTDVTAQVDADGRLAIRVFAPMEVNVTWAEPVLPIEALYEIGDNQGWKPAEGIEMTKSADNVFSATLTFTADLSYFAFTTVLSSDWTEVNANRFGGAENNQLVADGSVAALAKGELCLTIAAGTYEVTVDLNAMTATFKAATALDNVDATTLKKVIENGQVYIIKNGVRYSVLGTVVE